MKRAIFLTLAAAGLFALPAIVSQAADQEQSSAESVRLTIVTAQGGG